MDLVQQIKEQISSWCTIGKEDGKNAKLSYGFDHDEFYVPEEVYEDFKKKTIKRGKSKFNKWNKLFNEYKEQYPTEANN